jgi:hypothetical protein
LLVCDITENWRRSSEGKPAVIPTSSGATAMHWCWPRIGAVVFGFRHPVPRHRTELLVMQRKQALDHGRVLLADCPLAPVRRDVEGAFERRFGALVILKRDLAIPHALKVVGHINRTH